MRAVFVKFNLGNDDPYIVAENYVRDYDHTELKEGQKVWVFWAPVSTDTPEIVSARTQRPLLNIKKCKGKEIAGYYEATIKLIRGKCAYRKLSARFGN